MTAHETFSIETNGSAVSAASTRPDGARATLVLAHGAGTGLEHPFLVGLADALGGLGVATLRFNFPYREAGRRFPDRPPAAIEAWRAAFAATAARTEGEPIWAGGKSFGGRMASMAVADGMPAAGLVLLGYPLHPPGRPGERRDAHLFGLTLPILIVQGTRDPFATPEELAELAARIGPNAVITAVEGGTHSFEVAGRKRPQAEIGAELAPGIARFIEADRAA